MSSRENVKNAIAHVETERVPYALDLTGGMWEKLKPFAGGKGPAEFLDNDVVDLGVPWWGWRELGADWQGPAEPVSTAGVIGVGSYENTADAVKALKDRSDKYVLVRIYGSHFEKAHAARGIENFLADMAGEPDFARQLLDRIIEKNMVMLENFLAHPEIDGVLLGSDWGSQNALLISPEAWRDMIRPGEQKEYDLVHGYGKDVWIHSCGNIEVIIPDLIEMGVNVLNPVQPEAMDIAGLKEKYGALLTFWGGISTQQTLPRGTPAQVKEEARRVRDLMAKNGGYIFSPAQSIQEDVPVENVLALLDVAREIRGRNK